MSCYCCCCSRLKPQPPPPGFSSIPPLHPRTEKHNNIPTCVANPTSDDSRVGLPRHSRVLQISAALDTIVMPWYAWTEKSGVEVFPSRFLVGGTRDWNFWRCHFCTQNPRKDSEMKMLCSFNSRILPTSQWRKECFTKHPLRNEWLGLCTFL